MAKEINKGFPTRAFFLDAILKDDGGTNTRLAIVLCLRIITFTFSGLLTVATGRGTLGPSCPA